MKPKEESSIFSWPTLVSIDIVAVTQWNVLFVIQRKVDMMCTWHKSFKDKNSKIKGTTFQFPPGDKPRTVSSFFSAVCSIAMKGIYTERAWTWDKMFHIDIGSSTQPLNYKFQLLLQKVILPPNLHKIRDKLQWVPKKKPFQCLIFKFSAS